MLDAVLDSISKSQPVAEDTKDEHAELSRSRRTDRQNKVSPGETKVAIIGHPNVGKSTLLNQLTGTGRSIVSPIPGTTRDAVDEVVEHNGHNTASSIPPAFAAKARRN